MCFQVIYYSVSIFFFILLFDKYLLAISTSLWGLNTSHLPEIFQLQSNTHVSYKNFCSFDAYLSSTHEKLWLCYPYGTTQPKSIGKDGGKKTLVLVSYDTSTCGLLLSNKVIFISSHADTERLLSMHACFTTVTTWKSPTSRESKTRWYAFRKAETAIMKKTVHCIKFYGKYNFIFKLWQSVGQSAEERGQNIFSL